MTVYKANVPSGLGEAADRRGAASNTSGVNLLAQIVILVKFEKLQSYERRVQHFLNLSLRERTRTVRKDTRKLMYESTAPIDSCLNDESWELPPATRGHFVPTHSHLTSHCSFMQRQGGHRRTRSIHNIGLIHSEMLLLYSGIFELQDEVICRYWELEYLAAE